MTPGSYRASDADRDQVAEVLNSAYAEGRITLDEHQERTQAALEAKTFDDLTALTADLVPLQSLPVHVNADGHAAGGQRRAPTPSRTRCPR